MALNRLTLRTVKNTGDFTKNSVLSQSELDNNFIFLKNKANDAMTIALSAGTEITQGNNILTTLISSSPKNYKISLNSVLTGITSMDANTVSATTITLNGQNLNDLLNIAISGDTIVSDDDNIQVTPKGTVPEEYVVALNSSLTGLTSVNTNTISAGTMTLNGQDLETLIDIARTGDTTVSEGNNITVTPAGSTPEDYTINLNPTLTGITSIDTQSLSASTMFSGGTDLLQVILNNTNPAGNDTEIQFNGGSGAFESHNGFVFNNNAANRAWFIVAKDGTIPTTLPNQAISMVASDTNAGIYIYQNATVKSFELIGNSGAGMYINNSSGDRKIGLFGNAFDSWVNNGANFGIGLDSSINARLHVKGAGSTSATTDITIANSVEEWAYFRSDKKFIYKDGNQSAGHVLTSDGNGVATWQQSSSVSLGSQYQVPYVNSGATDFIYTDNIKFNGTRLGIGNPTSINATLHIQGEGTTSSTYAGIITNSTGTGLIAEFRDDKRIRFYDYVAINDNTVDKWGLNIKTKTNDNSSYGLVIRQHSSFATIYTVRGDNTIAMFGGVVGSGGAGVLAIRNATTAPASGSNSIQIYAADRGTVAGKAALHVRTEDNVTHVLGDLSGLGTITPSARLHIKSAGSTNSTQWLFSENSSSNTLFTGYDNGEFEFSDTSSIIFEYTGTRFEFKKETRVEFDPADNDDAVFQVNSPTGGYGTVKLIPYHANQTGDYRGGWLIDGNKKGMQFDRSTQEIYVRDMDGTAVNLCLNTVPSTFGETEGGEGVFVLANADTEPSSNPTDAMILFSTDLSAGNTIPGFRVEGSGMVGSGTPTQDRTVAVKINGTVYYLLASTSSS